MSDQPKRTIKVTRRRKTSSGGPRKRAAAPKRRRSDDRGSAPRPHYTGGGGSSRPPSIPAGGSLPLGKLSPKMAMLVIGLLVIFFICSTVFGMFNGEDEDASQQAAVYPTATTAYVEPVAQPTNPPKPFNPAALNTTTDGNTWLVMLYQDADDKVLEKDIFVDLNEAERVGSSEQVHIVSQLDRYRGGFRGDGNWTDTKRFYITQDNDLNRLNSQIADEPGEVNMASGDSLVDFVTWAVDTFPADKYVLILSDHGMGWPGGWSDPDPAARADQSSPMSSALGNQLFLDELDDALGTIRAQTGIEKFELIGLDACLMGHLEVFDALAPHARYAVASQETEPALGWAYTGFLQALKDNPAIDGSQLSQLIVQSYIEEDQRIVDEQARADLLGGNSPRGLFGSFGLPSAKQLAQQMEDNITLTAMDMAALPELTASVNQFAYALTDARQKDVARARSYAQSFTSIFGKQVPPSYIDLGNFAQLLKQESRSKTVSKAADRVLNALQDAVIAEKHGPKKPGATGVSIYFPNSQLYASPVTGAQSYTAIARRFAQNSLWDDFLAYHYTGRRFEATSNDIVAPDKGTPVNAPGQGAINVSPITLSDSVAAPGKPVTLSADIAGENIGYILFFTGFLDRESNSIFVADNDYLESADTREVSGVYYPDWGDGGEFTIEFEWEPLMFAINDGQKNALALFTPETYGASADEAVYTVDGVYTYAADGEQRSARLYFSNGVLQQVFGFSGQGTSGAPREIIPQKGDQFTITERWMDLNSNGKVKKVTTQQGETLTFGEETFKWEELDAAPGEYVLGFIVKDLDGNSAEVYESVTVE